jgi:hypothetical protein
MNKKIKNKRPEFRLKDDLDLQSKIMMEESFSMNLYQ